MNASSMFRRLFETKSRTYRHPKPRQPRLAIQELETRSLMAASLTATFDPGEGILRIEGTDQSEMIRIVNDAGSVRVDGIEITLSDGQTAASIPVTDVLYARVDGLAGDDRIEMVQIGVAPETAMAMEADGGQGNDTLVGGSAADRLFGGEDIDELVGGNGEDLLDGGGQEDIVIAGAAIDASALLQAYLSVDYVPYDPAATFGAELTEGEHFVFMHGHALVYFNVGSDGSISYDPALEGILSGQGTSSLTLNGAEVTIDASTLLPAYMTLDYVPLDPAVPLTTRLLPGDHFFFSHGDVTVWFNVGTDGTISYDPVLEGALSGQGTNALSLNGAEVTVDASKLLPAYMSLDYVPLDPAVPFTTRLLVGDHFIYTHGDVIVWFNVGTDGTISYDASLEGFLDGHNTNSLQLVGRTLSVKAEALIDTPQTLDYVPIDPQGVFLANLLPGQHFITTASGEVLYFTIGVNGITEADPALKVGAEDAVISLDMSPRIEMSLSNRVLRIEGTAVADKITIRQTGSSISVFQVLPNGTSVQLGRTYHESEIASIVVNCYGGADTVRNETVKNSQLRGGEGDDTLFGGHAWDDMYGDNGNDLLYGAPNGEDGYESTPNTNDTLWGGNGNDTLWGGYGHDLLGGQNGSDVLHGQWGNDMVVGSNWNFVTSQPDAAEVGVCNDTLFGENGNDTMYGGYGDDNMSGGYDSDLMYGEYANDKMWGAFWDSISQRPGAVNDDTLYGGNGNDYIVGGDGNDSLFGDAGNDSVYGSTGNDRMYGLAENDYLDGGIGHDVVNGGIGTDTLHGGEGADQLNGEGGADDLYGDGGDDALISIDAVAADRLFADAGRDTLWVDEVSGGLGTTAMVTDTMYGVDATFDRVQRVRTFANGADRTLDGDDIADPQATFDAFGNPIAANYRTFRTNPLFADAGPRRGDVDQNDRGDCWIMATVAGIADRTPWNVRSMVADAGDGTYLVRLGANFYRVDADLPTGGASGTNPRNAGLGAQNSLWVAVVEKAYAHFRTNGANHSYRSLDNGDPADAARAFNLGGVGQQAYGPITSFNNAGVATGTTTFGTAAALGNQIRTQWNAGRIVTVCTDGVVPAGSPMVANHCWAVTGFTTDAAGNVNSINLRNPWGFDLTVSLANMFAAGVWVTWGTP